MTEDLWPDPEPAPAPTVRARFDHVLRLEGLATAAKAAADAARAELDEEARGEYRRTGAAPTWRMPEFGTATLPLSKETVAVADINALLGWCRVNAPEQIRTVEEVRPLFQMWLTQNCVVVDGAAVHPSTGEVVPGLTVRAGGQPRSLSFRPEPAVRAAFVEHGEHWLADILGRQS